MDPLAAVDREDGWRGEGWGRGTFNNAVENAWIRTHKRLNGARVLRNCFSNRVGKVAGKSNNT